MTRWPEARISAIGNGCHSTATAGDGETRAASGSCGTRRRETTLRPVVVSTICSSCSLLRRLVLAAAGLEGSAGSAHDRARPTYRALVEHYGRPPFERLSGSAELRGAGPELTVVVSRLRPLPAQACSGSTSLVAAIASVRHAGPEAGQDLALCPHTTTYCSPDLRR
jgi:hypothetical protein